MHVTLEKLADATVAVKATAADFRFGKPGEADFVRAVREAVKAPHDPDLEIDIANALFEDMGRNVETAADLARFVLERLPEPPYGPVWYQAVVAEFNEFSPMMGLVLEPDQVEWLYEQALSGTEAVAYGTWVEDIPEEALVAEAARRTAGAIALLAYGGTWDGLNGDCRVAEAMQGATRP